MSRYLRLTNKCTLRQVHPRRTNIRTINPNA